MLIKRVGIGNIEEAFIEDRFGNGLNIIFSDDNNKGKTLVMQGIMYALGNEPIFPKGFAYKQYYFVCEIEVNGNIMKVLRKDRFFVVLYCEEMYKFDFVAEFKYFIKDKGIFDIPTISKKGINTLCGLELFYELFFVGQDKRNTSNIINRGQYNKEDFIQMLCSMNGYPFVEVDDVAINKRIKEIRGEMQTTKKLLSLLRDNPEISKYINKYGDTEAFKKFKEEVRKLNADISSYRRKRQLETNRKYKLEDLIQELNSLNREIDNGNVVCANCGSEKIIYKNRELSFEISNKYVRDNVIKSIGYQISQKDDIINECNNNIHNIQDKLQGILAEIPVELQYAVLYSETIKREREYDSKLIQLSEELDELKTKLKENEQADNKSKTKRKELKENILLKMNQLCKVVDPNGILHFEELFTKNGENCSGSDEQEYYYCRLLALNDYFRHDYPILIDSYREGEISSQKDEIMLRNFIDRKKQIIITSTLKNEEYSTDKYNKYEDEAVILDYSNNQASKLLQENYLDEFKELISIFSIILK